MTVISPVARFPARAGFGMAQTGNTGQGSNHGPDVANSAMSDYRDERRSTRDRRSRNRQARGAREAYGGPGPLRPSG